MSESFFSPSDHCFQINKNDRSSVLNGPGSSGSLSAGKLLQQQQIKSLNQAGPFQAEIVLNDLSKQELFWWIENLRLNNGRSLRQKKPTFVIPADASKSGWDVFCNGVSLKRKITCK